MILLLLTFAAFRLTHLITDDTVPGSWVRDRGPGWLRELTSCAWCCGLYVSAILVAVTDQGFRPLPLPGLWFLSVAAGVGLLSTWENR